MTHGISSRSARPASPHQHVHRASAAVLSHLLGATSLTETCAWHLACSVCQPAYGIDVFAEARDAARHSKPAATRMRSIAANPEAQSPTTNACTQTASRTHTHMARNCGAMTRTLGLSYRLRAERGGQSTTTKPLAAAHRELQPQPHPRRCVTSSPAALHVAAVEMRAGGMAGRQQ